MGLIEKKCGALVRTGAHVFEFLHAAGPSMFEQRLANSCGTVGMMLIREMACVWRRVEGSYFDSSNTSTAFTQA